MTEHKQLADTALQSILDTDATLANDARAAGDYDNSTELDFVADFTLYVVYDTTAPSADDIAAELYVLFGDGETPEIFPTGGDGTLGKDVDPGTGWSGTFVATNPTTNTATGISAATQANPVVITDTTHGLATGDHVYISGVSGMTEINDRFFEIEVVDANSFKLLNEDGTGHTAYTSGGTWWEVDVMQVKNVSLGPAGSRIVLKNISAQTYSAEWELKMKPKKAQSV